MTTLQRVAERAGVSTATVSKVLSNTPYFTEETRRKVMQAVEELGYVPNLAARALSSGKTNIIAVVFPQIFDAIFTDPFMLHLLEGVEDECHEHGYNMLMSTPRLTPYGFDAHYQQLIQSGYADGIVALDNVPARSVLQIAHERELPAVGIGYHDNKYYVRSDDSAGAGQIMQHVLELGHQRIGIISVAEDLNFSVRRRLNGLRAAAENYHVDFESLPRVEGDFSIRSGGQAADELLTLHPEITAIICLNDRMAMGAIQQARVLGRSIPENLTVVGYDDIPGAAVFAPPLTTINQQAPEIGRAATRMLFELIDRGNPSPVTMPPVLVVRQSSAPPSE
ncbi:MAG: LacI family transcriptional regulator [Anaerolineae bacterium]|nr:LacI family transcriptional regulator [Anaerolineae bacterium]